MKLEGRAYWRSQGLCVQCGGIIDLPNRYIRCVNCRKSPGANKCVTCGNIIDYPKYYAECKQCRDKKEKSKSSSKTENIKVEKSACYEVKKITSEQMKKQYEKCLHCVFGNPIDGTVVCAFPYCVNGK